MLSIMLYGALLVLLFIISAEDIKSMEVQDKWIAALAALGAAYTGFVSPLPIFSHVAGALCLAFALLVIACFYGGIGGADIKLIAAVGLFLGIEKQIVAIVICCVLFVAYCALRRIGRKVPVPMTPFISAGVWLVSIKDVFSL